MIWFLALTLTVQGAVLTGDVPGPYASAEACAAAAFAIQDVHPGTYAECLEGVSAEGQG